MDEQASQSAIERNLLPILIGFAPVAMLLMTWSYEPWTSVTVKLIRGYALPVVAIELLVVIIAFRDGLSKQLARWWRPIHWTAWHRRDCPVLENEILWR